MRTRVLVGLVVVLTALLLATTPVGAQAARLITGKDIKDSSVTGKDLKNGSVTGQDVKESTLSTVPSAQRLAVLGSGQTQSGTFSAAGANSSGPGGWLGFAINYPRPLATAIDNGHIIDTQSNPDPAKCPGAGHAARGYLCLYFDFYNNVQNVYGYSTGAPYNALPTSIGVGLYAPVTGSQPYIDGVWTVTAP